MMQDNVIQFPGPGRKAGAGPRRLCPECQRRTAERSMLYGLCEPCYRRRQRPPPLAG